MLQNNVHTAEVRKALLKEADELITSGLTDLIRARNQAAREEGFDDSGPGRTRLAGRIWLGYFLIWMSRSHHFHLSIRRLRLMKKPNTQRNLNWFSTALMFLRILKFPGFRCLCGPAGNARLGRRVYGLWDTAPERVMSWD
jgi:hypothetical protein